MALCAHLIPPLSVGSVPSVMKRRRETDRTLAASRVAFRELQKPLVILAAAVVVAANSYAGYLLLERICGLQSEQNNRLDKCETVCPGFGLIVLVAHLVDG